MQSKRKNNSKQNLAKAYERKQKQVKAIQNRGR